MTPDIPATVKITALTSEIDSIHSANSFYWKRGAAVTPEARAEYQRRLDRLKKIRNELNQLRSRDA